MRIGVISDTHGDAGALRRAAAALPGVEAWIHLGDLVRDAEALKGMTGRPVHMIRGNCDHGCGEIPLEDVIPAGDILLFAAHGNRYGVRYGPEDLADRAESLGCAVALYGHTHVSKIAARGRLLLLNPGSPHEPREGRKPSVALLEVAGGDYHGRIVTL